MTEPWPTRPPFPRGETQQEGPAPIIRGETERPGTERTSATDREPVRVPVLIATVLAGLIGVAVDLLMGGAWRIALAGFLTTLPPVLLGAEIARGKAWSPSSVWLAAVQARRDEAEHPSFH